MGSGKRERRREKRQEGRGGGTWEGARKQVLEREQRSQG